MTIHIVMLLVFIIFIFQIEIIHSDLIKQWNRTVRTTNLKEEKITRKFFFSNKTGFGGVEVLLGQQDEEKKEK